MLDSMLTLKDSYGNFRVYKEVVNKDPASRLRLLTTSTAAEPVSLLISHTASGGNDNLVNRTLIKHENVKVNANGKRVRLTTNLTIAVSGDDSFSNTDIENALASIVYLVTDGGMSSSGFVGRDSIQDIMRGGA